MVYSGGSKLIDIDIGDIDEGKYKSNIEFVAGICAKFPIQTAGVICGMMLSYRKGEFERMIKKNEMGGAPEDLINLMKMFHYHAHNSIGMVHNG